MKNFILSTANQREIQTLDNKIHETVETINQLKTNREFFLSFAKDPQLFINNGGIGTAIEKSTAVDPEGTYAYFLTGKKVVRFPVGSCSIYESCSVCMNRTRDPLVCVWCGSKCAHFGECTPSTALDLQRCPIVLEKVSPTKGPSSGGTLLTLEGDNFGSSAHEPDSSIKITVGNKPCALVHWNYTFVQCKTPAGQSDTLVDIVVAVNDTHWDPGKSFDVIDKKVAATKFQYQMSTFSGISPSYGPRAGGTSIALRGTNLDSGASQTVSVGSHPCHIHSVTNLTILCSTSRLKGSHPGGDETHRVTLRIDGQEVPYVSTEGLTGTFSYKPNPVVNKIRPASAPFNNPLVSSTVMEARMTSRKMVKMSLVPTFAQTKKIEDDWVTVGVLVNKSAPKTSKNGKPFSIWKLTDLQDCENLVSIFLFGEVHEKHWKTSVGSVVGFLNPSVMPNKDSYNGRSEVCLSIDHPGKVMLMGTSKDFGTCKGISKSGHPCTMVVNTYTCPYCVYHVKAEYRKMSSKRTELQASYSGVAPQGIRQKILQKSQIMYGGQMYINPSVQTTKALKGKDKFTLSSLKVARQAEDIEKAVRLSGASAIKLQHLSSRENQAINEIAAKSDFLGQALCKPGAGSRNFLQHVVKEKTTSTAPGPSKDVVSITAKDLLRMHQQKLKSLNGGAAQPQKMSPVLGRGLVNDRVVDLGTASVSGMKPLAASDIAKIKAIQKVRAKGPLVAKDPNAVKQDFTSPEAQARIQRKLDQLEPSGGDHSKDEESGSPKAKKSRLGPAMSKDEMEKLLRQKSSHAHQLDDLETEKEMQYFSVLEKKEQLEEKMLSVKEIQCDVVSCKICKYTAHQASDLCKKENHPLKHHKATKRFFKCKSCSHRTTTFARVPAQSCRKCNGSNFERTSMGKPKEGPKLPEEKLLIRGEEIKYINK
ncbi:protein MCM10 homolog isoform X2 [Ixodes scapularis]